MSVLTNLIFDGLIKAEHTWKNKKQIIKKITTDKHKHQWTMEARDFHEMPLKILTGKK
jgi:hypothetical protein